MVYTTYGSLKINKRRKEMEQALGLLVYPLIIVGIIIAYTALAVLIIWVIAHTEEVFTFCDEGTGFAATRGDSAPTFKISFKGHFLRFNEELGVQEVVAERDLPDGEVAPKIGGFLGLLEKYLGIFWVGIYPFKKRYKYTFHWSEWDAGKVGHVPRRRDDESNFFYVKTFQYSVELLAAEVEGNISANIEFSLFVKIIYPEIALFRVENWFNQLSDFAISRARLYAGNRTFSELRNEAGGTRNNQAGVTGNIMFSEYILGLNERISENEPVGVKERLGVEIMSAQMVEIDLAGTPEEISRAHKATTELYIQEQIGNGIRAIGKANADAIAAEGKAIAELGAVGVHLRRQQAIEKSGSQGNTIVFSDDGENNGLTPSKIAGLITNPLTRRGGDNGNS